MRTPTPARMHIGAHEGNQYPVPGDGPDPTPSDGGPLDDIKSGIKLWFDVGATIGKAVDRLDSTVARYLRQLERNTPVDYAAVASGVYPAAGFLFLNLGTPDQGTYWEVASCAVGGTDVNVTAAGTAGLYVAAFTPAADNSGGALTNPAGITSLADRAASLPNVAFYGTRQLLVNDQEYLYLCIFGGTPAQTYAANAQITVYNSASAKGKTDIIA